MPKPAPRRGAAPSIAAHVPPTPTSLAHAQVAVTTLAAASRAIVAPTTLLVPPATPQHVTDIGPVALPAPTLVAAPITTAVLLVQALGAAPTMGHHVPPLPVSPALALTAAQVTRRHAPPTTSVAALPAADLLRAHAPVISVMGTTWQWMWGLS